MGKLVEHSGVRCMLAEDLLNRVPDLLGLTKRLLRKKATLQVTAVKSDRFSPRAVKKFEEHWELCIGGNLLVMRSYLWL